MNYYAANRSWSDQFLPEIKRLVGGHLLSRAPDTHDWHNATDLMMLDAKDLRVAARVRRHGYANRYPNEFTIRCKIPSGGKTELSKIVEGKGDWMFYGHACAANTNIEKWWLIDLKAFRAALIRNAMNGQHLKYGKGQNSDGTNFVWFDLRSFPSQPRLLVANS